MPFLTAVTFTLMQRVAVIHHMSSFQRARLYGRLVVFRTLPYIGVFAQSVHASS